MDDNLAAKYTNPRREFGRAGRGVRELLDDVAQHLEATFENDDPWDQESADALARVYHGQAPQQKAIAPVPTPAPGIDGRQLLAAFQTNLDGVAARIGDEIARIDPAPAMDGLVEHLKAIEQRLVVVADDTSLRTELGALTAAIAALKADVSGIGGIDTHLKTFASAVDTKFSGLAKKGLDDRDVERMSRAVSDLMSLKLEANRTADVSEHSVENIAAKVAASVVSVLPPPAAPPQTALSDDELRRVAQSIGRVLEHRVTSALQASGTPRQGSEDIAQVRSIIEIAFQEQRQSDEQLTAMLTTMQQALIGMLDRMDALERQPAPQPLPPAPAPCDLPAAHVSPPAPSAPVQVSQNTDSFGSFAEAQPPAAQTAGKNDFLADARRAAGEAQLQQKQQQQPSRRKSQDKGPTAKAARRKTAAGSAVPRRILLALLAVVAAASAYVALTRKPARPAPPSTTIERPDAPKKSSALATDVETAIVQFNDADGAPRSPLDLLRQQEQAGIERLTAQLQKASASEVVEAPGDDLPKGADRELPPALVGPLSLRIAARDGNPSAQFAVAARLGEGRGVGQDLAQAVRWYHRSAQQGFTLAQYRLGTYYERGLGTPKNLPRAQSWYRRAAESGNVKAMHNLAVLATSRQMGEPDYVLAAQWFARASEHGLPDSLFNLAVLFESGLGVKQDYGQAYYYLALAARAGDQQAVKRLEQTRAKLAPDAASRIDNVVAAWQPKPLDPIANHPVLASNAWQAQAQRSAGG